MIRILLFRFLAAAFVACTAVAQTPASPPLAVPVASAGAASNTGATVAVSPLLPAVTTLSSAVIPPVGEVAPVTSLGETAVTLDVGNGFRAVPASRVSVPVGETLLITGPAFGGRAVQWLKNGRAIPNATGNLFVIQSVTSADAGTYQLIAIDPVAFTVPSQALILGVGPTDRLLNLSLRGTLDAGVGQTFTAGFVVAAATGQTKKLILRAVGPTLASFGVANPLRAPVLRIFDSAGKPYVNGYAYPAVVGGLTYQDDLAQSLVRTGAFPIPAGTLDAVVMMPFVPGAFTAQITSGDNTAGTVLIEIYEVP